MVKVYKIFGGNKGRTQLISVPKGYAGYTIGTLIQFEMVAGRLTLNIYTKPAEASKQVEEAKPQPVETTPQA